MAISRSCEWDVQSPQEFCGERNAAGETLCGMLSENFYRHRRVIDLFLLGISWCECDVFCQASVVQCELRTIVAEKLQLNVEQISELVFSVDRWIAQWLINRLLKDGCKAEVS